MQAKTHLRGWIRVSTRHDEKIQRDALAKVGCEAIHVCGEYSFLEFVEGLRKGEIVTVTTLGRITNSLDELKKFLKAVHAKKCHVWEVDTDRHSTDAAQVADMVLEAVSEQRGDRRAPTQKQARELQKSSVESRRKNEARRRTSEAEAQAVWYNPHLTLPQKLKSAGFRGWSPATAYRKFGSTRSPLGRRPSKSKRRKEHGHAQSA